MVVVVAAVVVLGTRESPLDRKMGMGVCIITLWLGMSALLLWSTDTGSCS